VDGIAVRQLAAPPHVHAALAAPVAFKHIPVFPLRHFKRQPVQTDRLVKRRRIANIYMIRGTIDPDTDDRVDICTAHIGAKQVGIVSDEPQKACKKRVAGVTRSSQIQALDAIQKFGQCRDSPGSFAGNKQELRYILKRNPA
jgi:hypothetical protein